MKFLSEYSRWLSSFVYTASLLCVSTVFADSDDLTSTLLVEDYVSLSMPAEFHIESTELEGPVYADANGRTLYIWPYHGLRNGYSGERQGSPACYDEVLTITAGLMSPYPPGILLPDLERRPSCTDLWPPVYASDHAEKIGKWTIINRKDGTRQWAYDEQPLYTSILDRKAGDVFGGSKHQKDGADSPAYRTPVGPPAKVPPGFAVKTTSVGRLLTTNKNNSVYAFEGDTADRSLCDARCMRHWKPVIAPAIARSQGEWTTLERSPGVWQWVFRGKPLYTYVLDQQSWSQEGSDISGWSNIYTQSSPRFPKSFTVQDTMAGQALANARGMTIYIYKCVDDSADQLSCDHPNDTQVYRMAICGAGNAEKCLRQWPYVEANENATSISRTWSVVRIDPKTGRITTTEQKDALNVWAYRDRPVYTYSGDTQPGDVHGGGIGEVRGQRNGYRVLWLRDEYLGATLL